MDIGEQPASSIYQEIKDIELDGIIGNERVIIEGSTNPEGRSYTSFAIQRFNPLVNEWRTEYTWIINELAEAEVENGYWNVTGSPAVLLKMSQKNGEWFSYRVVGYNYGILRELAARDGLCHGNVFFYGSSIIEQSCGQYSIWAVIDGLLVLVPY